MNISRRDHKDRTFKKLMNVSKWIRDHISRKVGMLMVDTVQDRWSNTFR